MVRNDKSQKGLKSRERILNKPNHIHSFELSNDNIPQCKCGAVFNDGKITYPKQNVFLITVNTLTVVSESDMNRFLNSITEGINKKHKVLRNDSYHNGVLRIEVIL